VVLPPNSRGRVVKADELPIRVGVKVVVGNLLQTQAAERSSTVCFTGAVIPQMSRSRPQSSGASRQLNRRL